MFRMETCKNRLGRLNIDKSQKIQIEEEIDNYNNKFPLLPAV